MAVHEGLVLKAVDESIRDDTDQWPEFSIKNVNVTSQATGELISLLGAHKSSPVCVQGTLEEVDPSHFDLGEVAKSSISSLISVLTVVELVKTSTYQERAIKINNVSTYSFSQFEDGTFGFWAGGQAGWFEIASASRAYQNIYQEMNEATGMFYFLADKYKKTRKSFASATAKSCEKYLSTWFNDYFNSDFCTRDDVDDVREVVYQHREFLIKSMFEGQECSSWRASPIWRHLKLKFPDDFMSIEKIILEEQIVSANSNLILSDDIDYAYRGRAKNDQESYMSSTQALAIEGEQVKPTDEAEDEEEQTEDVGVMTRQSRRKRKSGLRLKSTKSSKAATRKHFPQPYIQNKTSYINLSDDAVEMDEGLSMVTQPQNLDPLAQRTKRITPQDIGKTKLRSGSNPLPSYYEPRGHGDKWECPFDGCNRQVWNARDAESVEMIKLHFVEFHASNAQDLIHQESRPWVSVDHLLARVKGIASLQAKVTPQQSGFPPRVIRRF